ncbi:MAG: hypothetical protein HC875_19880 [Anaerolineales bacterium]|nr:hypothetical protein [Anaerolineales bacterium]
MAKYAADYWPALCNLIVLAIYLSVVLWLLLGLFWPYQFGLVGVILSGSAYLVLIVLDLLIRSTFNLPIKPVISTEGRNLL